MAFSLRFVVRRALGVAAAAALTLAPASAQIPVIDVDAAPHWIKELILLGKEIAIVHQMAEDTMVINDNIRYQISGFKTKAFWRMTIPPVVTVRVHNTNGETVDWNIATGGGYTQPGQVWINSSLQLSPAETRVAADPNSPIRPQSLATGEILSALGANGLATIQQNQQFLNNNAAAMNHLRSTILDTSSGTNSLTNQMQEVAATGSQNLTVNAQILQGQTASLGILTALTKLFADAVISDTQTQAQAQLARESEATAIGGMGKSSTR
jgi:hypothetical protein